MLALLSGFCSTGLALFLTSNMRYGDLFLLWTIHPLQSLSLQSQYGVLLQETPRIYGWCTPVLLNLRCLKVCVGRQTMICLLLWHRLAWTVTLFQLGCLERC